MKHLKLFEQFNNNEINLIVKFKDKDEYFKAIEFFQNNSEFFAEEFNDEFRSISFSCLDQDDADVTEKAIQDELDENDFSNFYFESEDTINSFEYNERINYDEDEEKNEEVESYSFDDLKANFRSWQYDHDNYDDAIGLFNILVARHPKEDEDKLKELAFNWVGYEENEENEEE
ncbi:hypothetical protein M0Q97_02660 [Candidatus Dojkabacteria bacterium]|jgi:hypothetical protein|nr:hypothetical protein [Candidatus Dojkabacteria bacterium]